MLCVLTATVYALEVAALPGGKIEIMIKRLNALRTNRAYVEKTPLVAVLLLEMANIQQLYRMWTEWTSAGQSVWGWVLVNLALWLWFNFYLVFNRENKFAVYGTAFGIVMNSAVIVSVLLFRYVL